MRGDRPGSSWSAEWDGGFTPHARGSTVDWEFAVWNGAVYPACAGIDRHGLFLAVGDDGLPRMRGDRPINLTEWIEEEWFTPHARGSTKREVTLIMRYTVYPACAGIDP